jgi:hypothetical protein
VKVASPLERLREAPDDLPRELARLILSQSEQLRRLARDAEDGVIHDALMALAGRCDATAAAILSHSGGHAANLTSRLSPK